MRAGEQVTPTLRLVRPVGYGSMGAVWAADHLTLGNQVAVKLIEAKYAQDTEMLLRFQQEARTTAQVRSPHVVQVLDHGVTLGGRPYFSMELLEGETLKRRLKRLARLPPGHVARLVAHTASALGRAHQIGIVHRDIKPENLFLTDVVGEPFVKVLDFGIAKHPPGEIHGLTDTQRFMGSTSYTSPEQLVSTRDVDHRTDLWALAVVAYEALTGRLPFQGETVGDQTLKVHAGGFPAPSTLRPELPSAVDAWAARALQQDPAGRFASAQELAEALEQALRETRGNMQATGPASPRADLVEAPAARGAAPSIPTMPTIEERYATLGSSRRPGSAPPRPRNSQEISIGARRVRIMQGNIVQAGADAGVEALVNATDERLSGSSGADLVIHSAAGPMLKEMTSRLGGCPVGRAVLTGAGQIPPPTRFVLHAVGPAFDRERKAECDGLLRSVYRECLRLADGNNIRSLAFPAISAGTSGDHGAADAASIAIGEVADYLAGPARVVDLVVFVLFSSKHYAAFAEALDAKAHSHGGQAS